MLFPKLAGSWGSILQTVCAAERETKKGNWAERGGKPCRPVWPRVGCSCPLSHPLTPSESGSSIYTAQQCLAFPSGGWGGGEPDPLFLRAAVSPAQQTSYIHLSAADGATFRILHCFIIACCRILISTSECSLKSRSKLILLQLQVKIRDTDSGCSCWTRFQTFPIALRRLKAEEL